MSKKIYEKKKKKDLKLQSVSYFIILYKCES